MREIPKTPEGILVRLKLKISEQLNIDPSKLKILVDKFVNNCFATTPNSRTHFAKVNIYNELSKSRMTIKVFFKFLRIINIKKLNITLTLTTIKDSEIVVSDEVNLFNTEVDIDE